LGWFYGFKLRLIVNHQGGIVAAKIAPANLHGGKALSSGLREKGITLVTNVSKSMKAKAISLWDRAMHSRRFIIETINDQLKNISQ
jgi:hypothetical protein